MEQIIVNIKLFQVYVKKIFFNGKKYKKYVWLRILGSLINGNRVERKINEVTRN